MPRRPRIESQGFHHIINRGVARSNIYLKDKDFESFLVIVQIAKERYNFTVHSLCLMDNHYHLLLETKYDNLSLIMRQINSKYAQYFNREYKRVGPLWQGRFKSWFVYDDKYLYILFRYIEQNPIKANIVKSCEEYNWSSSSLILQNTYQTLFENSILFKKEVYNILNKKLNDNEETLYNKFQKTIYRQDEEQVIRLKQKSLDEHFIKDSENNNRNQKILVAIKDGYKQSEIARYLGLSSASISYIVNKKQGLVISIHKLKATL